MNLGIDELGKIEHIRRHSSTLAHLLTSHSEPVPSGVQIPLGSIKYQLTWEGDGFELTI